MLHTAMNHNNSCRSCLPSLQCETWFPLAECMDPTCMLNYSRQLQRCDPEFHVQMVNVQSNSEFASHQLNRDTWSDPTVSSILMGSFIFWQVHQCTQHLSCHGNVIPKQDLIQAVIEDCTYLILREDMRSTKILCGVARG